MNSSRIIVAVFYYLLSISVLSVGDDKNEKKSRRLVVSLTTSPKRLAHLGETLKSLFDQTVQPDVIQLNLPHVFRRTGELYDNIYEHEFLNKKPVLIHRCNDTGPTTKLLPTLQSETDPNTLIVILDDDIYYPSFTLESIVNENNKHENVIVAVHCGKLHRPDKFNRFRLQN